MLCGLENIYSCAERSSNSRIRMLVDSQTLSAYRSIFYICVCICILLHNNYYYYHIILDFVSMYNYAVMLRLITIEGERRIAI